MSEYNFYLMNILYILYKKSMRLWELMPVKLLICWERQVG